MTEYTVTVVGLGFEIKLQPNETLLSAIERVGCKMRKSCRNGVCEICEVRLLQGEVEQSYPAGRFSAPCEAILACTSRPLTDLRIEIEGVLMPGVLAVKNLISEITSVETLNSDVYRVQLTLPATASQSVEYYAGQYLDLVLPDGKKASFSIASPPEMGRLIELHIRHNSDSDMSNAIVNHLKTESSVGVELPKGECYVSADESAESPLILVAASTGFSQVKSVVEHQLASRSTRPVYVYWGVRDANDFYLEKLPQTWQQENENIHVSLVVSEPGDSAWQGRTGLLPDAVLEDFDDLTDAEVMASGSPAMVYALLDACETKGLVQSQMKSDVFSYAPRPEK